MATHCIRARALRWASDEPQPVLVEVELIDARGKACTFINEQPMFDAENTLTPTAAYPIDTPIACVIVAAHSDMRPGEVRVSTARPCGVATVNGVSEFTMRADQVQGDSHDQLERDNNDG